MSPDPSLTVLDWLLQGTSTNDEIGSVNEDGDRASIARDLEVLLNCRRPAELVPPEYPECSRSILNFGVPEFDHYGNLSVPAEQIKLCATFQDAIGTFEPRLRNVTVQLSQNDGPPGILRFAIEGIIASRNEVGVFEAGLKQDGSKITVSTRGGA